MNHSQSEAAKVLGEKTHRIKLKNAILTKPTCNVSTSAAATAASLDGVYGLRDTGALTEALLQHQQAQLVQAAAMQVHANKLMVAAWQQMHTQMRLQDQIKAAPGLGPPQSAKSSFIPASLGEPLYVSTTSDFLERPRLGRHLVLPPLQAARTGARGRASSPEEKALSPAFVATQSLNSPPKPTGLARELKINSQARSEAASQTDSLLAKIRAHGVGCATEVSLTSLLPRIVEVAQDSVGSEHIAVLLSRAVKTCGSAVPDAQALHGVVATLTRDAAKLSWNQFGYVVIKRLFQVTEAEERRTLAMQFVGKVSALAKHKYGCWVLQEAFEQCTLDMQLMLVQELHSCVKSCIDSMHGNHVVQKCIELLPSDALRFILQAVEPRADRIAMHKYGCRVIQRLLDHCPRKLLEPMLKRILDTTAELAQDPFGNYVLRHLLEFGQTEDQRRIVHVVLSDFEKLASDKHASTVVERCFAVCACASGGYAPPLRGEAECLVDAMLHSADSRESPPFARLVDDRFGNYVVQRMTQNFCWNREHRERVRQLLVNAEPRLRATARGTKIFAVLLREVRAETVARAAA